MVEGVTATERRARRVYGALVWSSSRRGVAARVRVERLRAWAERLGLEPAVAREVEAAARAGRSLRIGRDVAERELLRRAAADVADGDASLLRLVDALLRRAPATRGGARAQGPFEESEVGPPLVWRPPATRLVSGRTAAMSSRALTQRGASSTHAGVPTRTSTRALASPPSHAASTS